MSLVLLAGIYGVYPPGVAMFMHTSCRFLAENRSRFTTAFMPLLAAFDWMEVRGQCKQSTSALNAGQ